MSLLRPGDLLPWDSMLIVDPVGERGSEVLTKEEWADQWHEHRCSPELKMLHRAVQQDVTICFPIFND
tara:strand:+ start:50 stop:253 length:204 start_codon:yes stop_codon:yes gene_type:complete